MQSNLDYEINKELGECYLFMGDLNKAQEYYQKAIGSNGVHADPYLGLATIAVQRGDLGEALRFYEKAAGIEDSDKAKTGMALVEMELGHMQQAFGHLVEALGVNPENVVAIFNLVRLGHSLGRIDEVLPHLENYLSIDPLKHEVRFTLAGCLLNQGDTEVAKVHLERILDSDPSFEPAQELLLKAEAEAA
jgi:tetratricopeptide (TPR) repeat protein